MTKLAINGGEPVRWKPFPRYPILGEEEVQAAVEVIKSHNLCSQMAEDSQVKKFEEEFAEYLGARFAVATSNGTTALHTAMAATGVGVGDEVIVPAYTFFSTATSVLMQNAIPIFADIEPETLGLDPESVRRRITPRTKAVIPVHMNGYPMDMDRIMEVAGEHGLVVIEDCSHAHGAEYKGRKVGTIGHINIFSFQQKKNLSLGEGGIVVTDNEELAEKARAFRSFGRVPLAYNYRMTELHAAIGRVRLAKLDEQNEQRIRNAEYLHRELEGLPGIKPQRPREGTKAVYYNYVVKYYEEELGVPRDRFVAAIEAEGIPKVHFYTPVYRHHTFQIKDAYGKGCPFTCPYYTAPPQERSRYEDGICPVAEEYCDRRNIEIKIHPPADLSDMADIATAFKKVVENIDEFL